MLSYRYDEKRKNNPHVGMVDTHTDGEEGQTTWRYDPHLDPALQFDVGREDIESLIDDALAPGDPDQMRAALEALKRLQSPYLNWAGKAERTSFEIDTVSLHEHERIDPATILAAVQKRLKADRGKSSPVFQADMFHAPFENLPLREAIDFYKHERDWANRLIAGDSLLVMNSLPKKKAWHRYLVQQRFSTVELRSAYLHAPPGLFTKRAWAYWGLMLLDDPNRPMPERFPGANRFDWRKAT